MILKGRTHREGEGGSGKADKVKEVAWTYNRNNRLNADKGGGGPKTQKFSGRHISIVPDLFSHYVPVVVAEARGGGEDVPGREDGADAPGPVHRPVPVLPRVPPHQHGQDPRLQARRDRRVLGRTVSTWAEDL